MRERVRVTVDEGIADVCLDRAEKRNALDLAMFHALCDAGEALAGRDDVRAVILRGEGASFCAGLDLAAMAGFASGGGSGEQPLGETGGRITHLAQQCCWVWQQVPAPVIAALHGHALGGGMQLALAADFRIAHPGTKLSVREVYWGLIPDMTGTLTLSRLVRPDVAKELVMTARILDAVEGERLGLVTRVAADPLGAARELAAELAARSPDSVRAVKRLFNGLSWGGAAEAFAAERAEIGALIGSPNQAEAVQAHFEQRPPRFG